MAKFCKNCGKQLGFLNALLIEDSLCSKECRIAYETKISQAERNRTAELSKLEEEIVESKKLTSQQVEICRRYDKQSLLNLYLRIYERYVTDEELDEEEIKTLGLIQKTFGLTNKDVNWAERIKPFVQVNALRKDEAVPVQSGDCSNCGESGLLTFASYRKHTGAIMIRQVERIEGFFCRGCVGKVFWSCQIHCLLMGWWGMISMFIGNPTALVGNMIMYARAVRRFRAI